MREEIVRHLRNDTDAYATMMVDYYALPDDWPARANSNAAVDTLSRSRIVEQAMAADIVEVMGSDFDSRRFIPFVLLHEFEALLFSDCNAFARAIGRDQIAGALQAIADAFDSPEHINDSPFTAPSKRILAILPGYTKVLSGSIAAIEIGIERMEATCSNFARWLLSLKNATH